MFSHPNLIECQTLIDKVRMRTFGQNYGLMITGVSGVGKTLIGTTYVGLNPPRQTPENAIIPVLYVKLAETKTAADLLLQIMKGITQATGTVIPHLIN